MIRCAALAGISLSLFACSNQDDGPPPVPGAVVVLDDSAGNTFGGASLSPDGTRIAFNRTVAGRSAVFVAAADGSNPVRRTHGVWDATPIWSPDGRWIAYHAEDPDFDAMVVSADSGAPRQLTSGPGRDFPNSWVRDGSGVIFTRRNLGDEQTMVVPFAGGEPRRLGPVMAGDQHAAFSPDGTKLSWDLHNSGGATVWVQDSANGGAPRQLTTENLENAGGPSNWSPDGTRIVYTSGRTGTMDLWITDLASGEARQLTSDVRDDFMPRWSPEGRWIAFLSDRGGQRDIWLVPSAGGNARRLTNDRAVESNPRWTPDGQSVYYARDESDAEILFLPVDGGPERSLLAYPGFGIASAALSPDDRTVLFESDRSGNADIWSLRVSGGEPAPFVASPLNDVAPLYSPDGSQVLFVSTRGGSIDLWLVPASGGEPRNLTAAAGDESSAAWSRDGKWIAFSSNRDVSGGDLWVIPATGAGATRLTRDNLRPGLVEWSPDGKSLYFVGDRPGTGGGRELYRIAASGGRPEALGAKPGIGNSRLSPDGSQLAYSSYEGGWAFLDVVASTGGAPRRLTKETENIYHPFALWFPDGTRLLVYDLDLAGNQDATDLSTVRPSDGVWQRLTRTPLSSEVAYGFTKDGSELLVVRTTNRSEIRRVPVADVIAERK